MFNNKFITGALIAATAMTGALSHATSAAAADVWDTTPPKIFSGASQGFNHKDFQQFVQAERVAIPNIGQKQIDANNLFLKYDYNVKVSFVNEGAGYRNQLAFGAVGATTKTGLLFKDIACSGKTDGVACVGDWGGNTLKLGDTVKMGAIKGGTQLDFFLRGDGLNRNTNAYTYSTKTAQNADGLQHVVSYTYGKKYLVMGFEDLYGTGKTVAKDPETGKNVAVGEGKFGEVSDRDFNDTVFVVDIGEQNVNYLNSIRKRKVPEPAAVAGLVAFGATAWGLKRLRRRG
jgi:Domain of unknown function (DUF4114)